MASKRRNQRRKDSTRETEMARPRAELSCIDLAKDEGELKLLDMLKQYLEIDVSAETETLWRKLEEHRQQDPYPVIGLFVGDDCLQFYDRKTWLNNKRFVEVAGQQDADIVHALPNDEHPPGTVFLFLHHGETHMRWLVTVLTRRQDAPDDTSLLPEPPKGLSGYAEPSAN